MKITVLLADDHTILRQGLRALLEPEEDIEVVAEACNGREAIAMTRELAPRVVVMDLTMPEVNGVDAIRQIVTENPAVKVLALSMVHDRGCVMEALKAGATGYLLKDCAAEELVGAIRKVAQGQSYLGPKIATLVIRDFVEGDGRQAPPTPELLSPREREVLRLIADGCSTKEIAFSFGVSVKTVETQRSKVMKKLKLFTVADLTKFAIRQGMTTVN
ncbi:DNA-binding response regulator [Geomonas sp. Red276]